MDIYIDLDKDDAFYQALLEYPIEPGYDMDFSKKIKIMVCNHNELYQMAKGTMQNVFTLNEVKLILSTLIFRNESEIRDYSNGLYLSLLNNCEEEYADDTFEVDKESLLDRIDTFTDIQAFVLPRMATEVKKELVRFDHTDLLEVHDFIIELFKPKD